MLDWTSSNWCEQSARVPSVSNTSTGDSQRATLLFLGRVLLVRHREHSDEKIALKVLDKQVVVRMKQIDHTLQEKRILQALSCPFIVKLLYTFKDNSYLYLGLEYAPGGEMFTHLRAYGRYTEEMTRFYASQIVLAFEYLHHLGVVRWRRFSSFSSLRPRLDLSRSETGKSSLRRRWVSENGKKKVRSNERNWSLFVVFRPISGSLNASKIERGRYVEHQVIRFRSWREENRRWHFSEYLAPEIILSRGYNKGVDYWALGVLMVIFPILRHIWFDLLWFSTKWVPVTRHSLPINRFKSTKRSFPVACVFPIISPSIWKIYWKTFFKSIWRVATAIWSRAWETSKSIVGSKISILLPFTRNRFQPRLFRVQIEKITKLTKNNRWASVRLNVIRENLPSFSSNYRFFCARLCYVFLFSCSRCVDTHTHVPRDNCVLNQFASLFSFFIQSSK